MNLWAVFLTGLSIGGLTCLAVQGGLLASAIAERENEDFREKRLKKHNLWPVGSFLVGKFIVYTCLGFLLGLFGNILSLTNSVKILMQFIAGIYMVVVALDLLKVHPIFRYAIISPPRFLSRFIRNKSKSADVFTPALLGVLTIFIPCGTTLAVEALAISSGNALNGALTMAVFTIGTMPLFLGVGFLTTSLGDIFRSKFLKLAAVLILFLGINSVNGALTLTGSSFTFQNLVSLFPIEVDLSAGANDLSLTNVSVINGVQTANIAVHATSYNPNYIQVKSGQPVRLNLTNNGDLGCTSVFVIPKVGINKTLSRRGTDAVEFTPVNKGKLTWTCSMGMYTGMIEVI